LWHFVFTHAPAFAGQIGPIEPLGDDSFEPVLRCRLTEDLAADYGLVGRIRHFTTLGVRRSVTSDQMMKPPRQVDNGENYPSFDSPDRGVIARPGSIFGDT
jgi:hypothetical protein